MDNKQKSTRGRKAANSEQSAGYQVRRQINLDNASEQILRTFGAGNLSAGIRKAASIINLIKAEKD